MTLLATRHLWGVEVTADDQALEWREGATDLSVDIPTGTYWCYRTALSGYPSLYDEIAAQMTAESLASGSGYTYVVEVATPTSSAAQVGAGVRIRETGGNAWSLKRLCEFNGLGVLGVAPSGGAYLASASGSVVGEWTARGVWTPPVAAEDWRSAPERIIAWSTERTNRADFYAVDSGTARRRTLIWREVLAAHVRTARAQLDDYASAAGLALGDTYNAFEELWTWASSGGVILTGWYANPASIVETLPVDAYEIARLGNLDHARSLNACARMIRAAGEWYDVELDLLVISGGYDQ